MLAYADLSKYPYPDLISNVQLCRITSRINAELNKRQDPKLIMLLRLMFWGQENLSENMNFPQLTEISEGKFEIFYKEKLDTLRADHNPVVLTGEQLGLGGVEGDEDDF